jgi:hypothetical protein
MTELDKETAVAPDDSEELELGGSDGDGDWARLFTASDPWSTVERIIRKYVDEALASLTTQLAADPEFTANDRAEMLRRARPLIHRFVHAQFEMAFLELHPAQ